MAIQTSKLFDHKHESKPAPKHEAIKRETPAQAAAKEQKASAKSEAAVEAEHLAKVQAYAVLEDAGVSPAISFPVTPEEMATARANIAGERAARIAQARKTLGIG